MIVQVQSRMIALTRDDSASLVKHAIIKRCSHVAVWCQPITVSFDREGSVGFGGTCSVCVYGVSRRNWLLLTQPSDAEVVVSRPESPDSPATLTGRQWQ